MNAKTFPSGAILVLAVVFLAVGVSFLTTVFLTPTQRPTTVIVQRPWWQNYRSWWGYHGAGLPGWGGPKYPPMPPPHPKPPKPSPPPASPPANPSPASPPPSNPPPQ